MTPYSIKSRITFALAHAVKLAEGGEVLHDRQIGQDENRGSLKMLIYQWPTAYQYCIQNLPPNHELHLMLVNTVRKV